MARPTSGDSFALLDSSDFPPTYETAQHDVVIGVMGSTGSGKSSFIQLLTGKNVKIGNTIDSETSEVEVITFLDPTSKRNIVVVDTPGFDDSREGVTDTDILKKITEYLLAAYDAGKKLSGLIYVQRISDPRFGGQSVRNLRMFRSLCGTDSYKNIIVLTTFWDCVDSIKGVEREGQLKTKAFKDIVTGGGRFMRHDCTAESAREVLRQIIPLPPTNVKIQDEIRVQGKTLEETTAGSVQSKEVAALIAKHKKELQDIRDEMKEAQRKGDQALKELREERDNLEVKLAGWQEEQLELKRGLEEETESRKKLESEIVEEKAKNQRHEHSVERNWTQQLEWQGKLHAAELQGARSQFELQNKTREVEEQRRRAAEAEGRRRRGICTIQ